MSEQAKDKIGKLLNMTVANGCTEDEQETALRMAANLAAKAGIDLDACRAKDAPKPKAKYKSMSQQYKPHQALAAQAAAMLFGVECNVYNLGADGLAFVGREENIELAEQTMFWLMRQVELLYKHHLPAGMTQTARSEYRKTFKAACAMRVLQRAAEVMRDMKRGTNNTTGHNALVVLGHFEQLEKEVDAFWDEQRADRLKELKARAERTKKWADKNPEAAAKLAKEIEKQRKKEERLAAKRKGRRGREIPVGNGSNDGHKAGDRVQLRKEVS